MLTENSEIVDRLMQIVTATSATVQTKNGPVEDELTADKNSLTAAKSLFGAHLEFLKRGGDRQRGRGGARNAHAPAARSGEQANSRIVESRLSVRHQNVILDRLMQIVSKQTVTVWTKNGPVADEVAADKNSIAAAKFLIALQAKYQKYSTVDADIVQLNAHYQKVMVERLMQILSKTFVIRQTKFGPFEDEVIADRNAIRAAKVLIAYNSLKIGEPVARSVREGEIGRGGDRETEMLLRASVASESRWAGDGSHLHDRERFGSSSTVEIPSPRPSPDHRSGGAHAGARGLERTLREKDEERRTRAFVPRHDTTRRAIDFPIFNPSCDANEPAVPDPSPQLSPDHRSGGALAGARGQGEIAHDHLDESIEPCEPDLAPSDLGFTAEDVVRESLKIVLKDRPDLADKIDKDALIERVRAKLDRAARENSELKVESRPIAAREEIPLLRRESCDEKVQSRQRAAKNLEKIA